MKKTIFILMLFVFMAFPFVSAAPMCADSNGDPYADGAILGDCLKCECDAVDCEWVPQDGTRPCHVCTVTTDGLGRAVTSDEDAPGSCIAFVGSVDRTCLDPATYPLPYYCGDADACGVDGFFGVCTSGNQIGVPALAPLEAWACEDACYNPNTAEIFSDDACFDYDDDGDGRDSSIFCDGTRGGGIANIRDRDESQFMCTRDTLSCLPENYWGAYGENRTVLPGDTTDYLRFHGTPPISDVQCCGDDANEFASITPYSQDPSVLLRFPDGAACCDSPDVCFGPIATNTLAEQNNVNRWQCHGGGTTEICQMYDPYPQRIYYDADCDGLYTQEDPDCFNRLYGYVYSEIKSTGARTPLANADVFIEGKGIGTTTDGSGYYEITNIPPDDIAENASRVVAQDENGDLVPALFVVYFGFDEEIEHNFTLYDRDCQSDCSNGGHCDRTCQGEGGCSFKIIDIDGDGFAETNASNVTDPGAEDRIGFNRNLNKHISAEGDNCRYITKCDGTIQTRLCLGIDPDCDSEHAVTLDDYAQDEEEGMVQIHYATFTKNK